MCVLCYELVYLWMYNLDNENVEEKKRRSSTKLESSKSGSIVNENENSSAAPTKSRAGTVSEEAEGRTFVVNN